MDGYDCYLEYSVRTVKKKFKILHQQHLIVKMVVMVQFNPFWYGFKDLVHSF